MKKKKVIILGATGSIGTSAVKILRDFPDLFEASGFHAHASEDALLTLSKEFSVKNTALSGGKSKSGMVKYHGADGVLQLIRNTESDIVLNGISGYPGLFPSLCALESGNDLALANKESIVVAGNLLIQKAAFLNKKIIPVDSEHSAIFHLLENRSINDIKEIILTASGGPFRETPLANFYALNLEDVLKHPTWDMGTKITVDSATMANKGLEIIEASILFSVSVDRIKVLIHPQSMVHSLIRTADGSMYAQVSNPDMRIPIQNALTYPAILESSVPELNLSGISLDFSEPERDRYPLLFLAYHAAKAGKGYPLAFNAANEEAVNAFLKREIGYTEITSVVTETLDFCWEDSIDSFDIIQEYDQTVRDKSRQIIRRIGKAV